MLTQKHNPFDDCPVYKTHNLICRLVDETDAHDLYICYNDKVTLSHMNNDNCGGDFNCPSVDFMRDVILSWHKEYNNRRYIRWSVADVKSNCAIGTIELAPIPWGRWFFGKSKPLGIFRIDLRSDYETETIFSELMGITPELAADFEIEEIATKALHDEVNRRNALHSHGFHPHNIAQLPFDCYYLRNFAKR